MWDPILAAVLSCPHKKLIRAVFSGGKGTVQKAIIKPILLKGQALWQCESFRDNQAFHQNLDKTALSSQLTQLLQTQGFRQVNVLQTDTDLSFRITKKGKIFQTQTSPNQTRTAPLEHNREKQHIFTAGMPIHPLVELGVFDKDFQIIPARADKFKQINHFIGLIATEFKNYKGDTLRIIDFGCGKSYLTFLVYYYFTVIRGLTVQITGYDLKETVIADCTKIAQKLSYTGLQFVHGDICKAQLEKGAVDMILTLHACDTATDYALHFAVKHHIRHIFSVPCCQHELNAQVKTDSPLSLLLTHGLYKERFSALLTDCIRCEVLTRLGYDVDVVEFVQMENTPKNAMLRATRTPRPAKNHRSEKLTALLNQFHLSQCLVELCDNDPLIQNNN